MMSFKAVMSLRRKGELKNAHAIALSEWVMDPDNIWTQRAYAWTCYDYIKESLQLFKYKKALEYIKEFSYINLPETELVLYNSIARQIDYLLYRKEIMSFDYYSDFFGVIKKIKINNPALRDVKLLKKIINKAPPEFNALEIIKWWGIDNFTEDDYLPKKTDDNKTYPSNVEQVFIALAKNILSHPVDKELVKECITYVEDLKNRYPEMQYMHFYHAKLLLALDDKNNFLNNFIHFAKKNKNQFWVWELLSEAFDINNDYYTACLCNAVTCKVPEKFLVNVYEKLAEVFLKRKEYQGAVYCLQKSLKIREQNNWKITDSLRNLKTNPNLKNITPPKDINKLLNKYIPLTQDILFMDLPGMIIVIEKLNTEKSVAYFVADNDISGMFNYTDLTVVPQQGKVYYARFVTSPLAQNFRFYKVKLLTEKPYNTTNFIREITDELIVNKGNSFGYVKGVFVPPDLLKENKHLIGQKVNVTAIKSYNKKTKKISWKAMKIDSNDPNKENININIVSDENIPNVKFIKEFKNITKSYIFITTQKMIDKNKIKHLVKTMNIDENQYEIIIIDDYKIKDINEKLKAIKIDKNNTNNKYLVNITGGTKLMSLLTMSHFIKFDNAKLFYLPYSKSIMVQVYPYDNNGEIELKQKLTLNEVLSVYGIELITYYDHLIYDLDETKSLMNELINNNGNKKKVEKFANAHSTEEDGKKSYYGGRWFEEWMFNKLKTELQLNDEEIFHNVTIRMDNTVNEFDVLFFYQDWLYIVECKVYYNTRKKIIEEAIYKIDALNDKFGIKTKTVFATTASLSTLGEKSKTLIKRAENSNIKIIQFEDIKNDNITKIIQS